MNPGDAVARGLALGGALLLLAPAVALAAAGGGGHDFGPFDREHIPIEVQAWWTIDPDNHRGFGHIHALMQWPLGSEDDPGSPVVSGVLRRDVRIVLHDNPSRLTKLRFDVAGQGVFHEIELDEACPYTGPEGTGSSTCAFNVPVELDTRDMPNGTRTLKIRATAESPDGKRWTTTSDIPIHVENPGGERAAPSNFKGHDAFRGKSWYEGPGYQAVWVRGVPLAPVCGRHAFELEHSKGTGPRRMAVALDKTHAIPAVGPWAAAQHDPGELLFEQLFGGGGPIALELDSERHSYRVNGGAAIPLARPLADGWHSIGVRVVGSDDGDALCEYCRPEDQGQFQQSANTKLWFLVDCGGEGEEGVPTEVPVPPPAEPPPDPAGDFTADRDGDGFDGLLDCDDSNPAVSPGASEICGDGIDNDCDARFDCRDRADCRLAPECSRRHHRGLLRRLRERAGSLRTSPL